MRAKSVTILVFSLLFVNYVLGKPIRKEKEEQDESKKEEEAEYLRYLGQVRCSTNDIMVPVYVDNN